MFFITKKIPHELYFTLNINTKNIIIRDLNNAHNIFDTENKKITLGELYTNDSYAAHFEEGWRHSHVTPFLSSLTSSQP